MIERVLDESAPVVAVTARLDRPVSGLELCGELPCWQQPIAMQRSGSTWEAQVRVGPGVYEIKVREPSGAWLVDPAWRTVARDGASNGVLVVGGTDEPVLHAPAAPWLRCLEDGRIVVRAALRRGHRDRLGLRIDDGARLAHAPDARGRWRRRAIVGSRPSSPRRAAASNTRSCSPTDARSRRAAARSGSTCASMSQRFQRGGATRWSTRSSSIDSAAVARRDAGPIRPRGRASGAPAAISTASARRCRTSLDLGVTALHLTPMCVAPSRAPLRRDRSDARSIPSSAGMPRSMRCSKPRTRAACACSLDVASTHVHRDFAPFRDVRAHGPASPYWRWFRAKRWPFFDGPDPGYDALPEGAVAGAAARARRAGGPGHGRVVVRGAGQSAAPTAFASTPRPICRCL